MLRRLDALGRFLLKRMHHPDVFGELQCVDNAERVTPERQAQSFEVLRRFWQAQDLFRLKPLFLL